jgi:hypothetical protein
VPEPNLYILGPPRTATTSLARWLGETSAIRTSRPKEPGYHIHDRQYDDRVADLAEYLALYASDDPNEIYGCDATPWYLSTPGAERSIAELCPEARLIVTLRHPADMLASLHAYHRFRGVEAEPDIETALFGPRPRLPGDFRRSVDYLEVARVGRHLERYASFFALEQVYILDFEKLAGEPEVVLRDLLEWLGIDRPADMGFMHVNRTRYLRVPALRRPLDRIISGSRWQPLRLVAGKLRALNTVRIKPSMPAAVRSRILDELADDIELLGKLTGRDLMARWT